MGTLISLTDEDNKMLVTFFESLGSHIKEETIRVYMGYYKTLKKEVGIRQLTQEEVNKFLYKHTNSTSRAFLKNFIEFNKWKDLTIPRRRGTREHKVIKIISESEFADILNYISSFYNIEYYYALRMIYDLALRRNEVLLIRKMDFNLLKLAEEVSKGILNSPCELTIKGKGKKERIVLVNSQLLWEIYDYVENKYNEELIFPIKKFDLWRAFNKACLRLGFIEIIDNKEKAKYHLHSLRHARATLWLNEDVNLIDIKERLGHLSVATTQLYTNPDAETSKNKWKAEMMKK